MILIILTITVLTTVYYFFHLNYEYWKKRGILGPKPKFLVGNMGKSFILKATPGEVFFEAYNQYKNEEVVGLYRALTPVLLIRDPELIKEVTVKSFSSFHNNDVYIDKNYDPIVGRNIFVLTGDEWKNVRQKLTPGFTSGKMKWLYPLLEEVAENLVKFIDKNPETTNGKGYEAKELCARFTLNNVASCAFGIEGKCFEEKNSYFRQLAMEFFPADSWSFFGIYLATLNPSIVKYLPIKFVTKSVENKLRDLVQQTVKYREDNNVVRNDFLHILIQLKKTSKDNEFTDIDIVAQAAAFFGDGYETSAGVMSFVLYTLAENPKKH